MLVNLKRKTTTNKICKLYSNNRTICSVKPLKIRFPSRMHLNNGRWNVLLLLSQRLADIWATEQIFKGILLHKACKNLLVTLLLFCLMRKMDSCLWTRINRWSSELQWRNKVFIRKINLLRALTSMKQISQELHYQKLTKKTLMKNHVRIKFKWRSLQWKKLLLLPKLSKKSLFLD